MSMKIKVSYTDEEEAAAFLSLLRPVIDLFKVKKSEGTPPYKHMYFIHKKGGNPHC